MRIIAGQRRGHRFEGPKGNATRPTSDMVRESLFNILGAEVEGRVVLDLFAGTGALGFEALSRGAARAVLVERDRETVALIYRNLKTLRFEDRARVVLADAYRWARRFEPEDAEPVVVFLDPPYRDYEVHAGKVHELLARLVAVLPPGSTLAVEASRELDDGILPDPDAWDQRRHGATRIAIRTLAVPGASAPDLPAAGPLE